MAQYKVPQDVEADDKLLGPFSFRQFVYLMIAAGCIALAVALFQLFPLLAILPAFPALFFIILALPLKKDQPMETYLAAIVSYYLKPHKRMWTPGQRESTILITAPKQVDEVRTRDITGEEATHRLSFLADIVDTEGQAIKGMSGGQIKEEIVAEANSITDMFETNHFTDLESTLAQDESARHKEVVDEMREAIKRSENLDMAGAKVQKRGDSEEEETKTEEPKAEEAPLAKAAMSFDSNVPDFNSDSVVTPDPSSLEELVEKPEEKTETEPPKPSIIELANNPDFSVATIAKEANRIKERDEGEVFISLH